MRDAKERKQTKDKEKLEANVLQHSVDFTT